MIAMPEEGVWVRKVVASRSGVLGGYWLNAAAMARTAGRKEAAATWFFPALIAVWNELVFPVRDRLAGVRPNGPVKNALRKIIDGDVYAACRENVDGFGEVGTIVEGINPQEVVVGDRESGILEPH